MKHNTGRKAGGFLLILCGIMLAGRILHWFTFNVFFDGWWTLFLIVPNAVSFFSEPGKQRSALKGLVLGILLLMAAQGFIEISMLVPLLFAAFLIMIGYHIMWPGEKKKSGAQQTKKTQEKLHRKDWPFAAGEAFAGESDRRFEWNEYANRGEYRKDHRPEPYSGISEGRLACTAMFSGKELFFDGKLFCGAMLSAVFGAITLDLRNAVISEDSVIDAIAIFGGIDILVPENVRVEISGTPVFGGLENHAVKRSAGAERIIRVRVTCAFGGIEIK